MYVYIVASISVEELTRPDTTPYLGPTALSALSNRSTFRLEWEIDTFGDDFLSRKLLYIRREKVDEMQYALISAYERRKKCRDN